MSAPTPRSRSALGLTVGVLTLVTACSGGGSDAARPAGPSAPAEFSATFEVDSPIQLMAGEGQAWLLTPARSGATLSTIDHTGRVDDVLQLPGQGPAMAPYRDGVVVARAACDAEDCTETAVKVLVVDGAGSTVAEAEFARRPGGIQDAGEVRLIGVSDDVVWFDTSDGLIGHDMASGRTVAQVPSPQGVTCLLAGGLHTLVPLDGQYFGHGGLILAGAPDPQYDAEFHRLVDGKWTPVPDSVRPLTDGQFQLARCFAGGVRTDSGIVAAPAWSPESGWVDQEPYLRPLSLEVVSEPVAGGQANQLFVLESDGVMRRWFAGPDGPISGETLEVPADVFRQPFGPGIWLDFDRSATVVTGCAHQVEDLPLADCWIGSVGE